MNGRERFLAACRHEPVDGPPVWIMRQAGRYLPEYLAFREQHSFLDICRTPELALEVALQPLRRYALDATIVFSDILVVPEAMGQAIRYPDGGPVLTPALGHDFDPEELDVTRIGDELRYVYDAVALLHREVGQERAVLGFAGAPFSLASYMVEGGGSKRHQSIKTLLFRDPERGVALLERVADAVATHLELQIAAGADAVQLFDTWAGALSPDDYARFCLPSTRRILQRARDAGAVTILFINGLSPLVAHAATAGADVLGVDWRVQMSQIAAQVDDGVALQGNLDPVELFGRPERIARRVREMVSELGRETGYIANLGHGILPGTPTQGAQAFVDAVVALRDRS